MHHTLINRSADLQRLLIEGYDIEVYSGYLLMKQVPYVTATRGVQRGTLVSELTLAGDVTTKPRTHVVTFFGEMPCDTEGRPLTQIIKSSVRRELASGLTINHRFSSKPKGGYQDYYQKMTTYEKMISGPAQAIDPGTTARTFPVVEARDEGSVFLYTDTASSRVGISMLTNRLACDAVAIVGLGGTGSYILDFVAKTPVRQIHLFDGDQFLQHNAFRSPGAPSIEVLKAKPHKVDYLSAVYSHMRRNIVVHSYVDETTVDELRTMDFVFVAVDSGPGRRLVMEKLIEFGTPFIDVGMGVVDTDSSLGGQLRVTASTHQSRGHIASTVPVSGGGNDHDDYSSNIQIAELNALNAALAVVKWKKLMGFYTDLVGEHTSIYQIDGNYLINEDRV